MNNTLKIYALVLHNEDTGNRSIRRTWYNEDKCDEYIENFKKNSPLKVEKVILEEVKK